MPEEIGDIKGALAKEDDADPLETTVSEMQMGTEKDWARPADPSVSEKNTTVPERSMLDVQSKTMAEEQMLEEQNETIVEEQMLEELNETIVEEQMLGENNEIIVEEQIRDENSEAMAEERMLDEGKQTGLEEQTAKERSQSVPHAQKECKKNTTVLEELVADEWSTVHPSNFPEPPDPPLDEEEDLPQLCADHGIVPALLAIGDFGLFPITATWSSLHFFHMDEIPWHRLQNRLPVQPAYASMAAEDLDQIEAPSGPSSVVTNRKTKTSWSRATTMNSATAILIALFIGLIICGVACAYHSHRASSRVSPLPPSSLPAEGDPIPPPPPSRRPSPICTAPAQSTADDLQTFLFKMTLTTATANLTTSDTTRLAWIISSAEATLSRRVWETSNTFHLAVVRIAQAESLLLSIDRAILLGADPLTHAVDDESVDGDIMEDSAPNDKLLYTQLEGTQARAAVASHLHLHGPTCLRLALQSSRRLRTEVLGIQPISAAV